MIATKKDIEKINENLSTLQMQVNNVKLGLANTKNDLEYFIAHKTPKPKYQNSATIDPFPTTKTMTVAIKEETDKQYEETKNAIINLQKQINNITYEKLVQDYNNKQLPNWATDSVKMALSLENSELQNSKEKLMELNQKNLKKIQELEYANKTLQEQNEKLNKDSIVVKYITDKGIDIDHLQFRLSQAEKQIMELLEKRANLLHDSTNQQVKIQELENKIKLLEMVNQDLKTENRRMKFFN